MTTSANSHRYLESLAEELRFQSTRVRDLIGSAHWLSDGHHKEYLLSELLARHVPGQMMVSRGFIVSAYEPDTRSKEQDLLIIDTSQEAPLFNQGGLVITFPRAVLAAISVKTTMSKTSVLDAVRGLASARRACEHAKDTAVWCGAYFFETSSTLQRKPAMAAEYLRGLNVTEKCARAGGPLSEPTFPDLMCAARGTVYRIQQARVDHAGIERRPRVAGYKCGRRSTAVFLGSLLDHLASSRDATDSDFSRFADVDTAPEFATQDI